MLIRGPRWTTPRILDRIGQRRIRSLDLYDTSADDDLLIALAKVGSLVSLDFSSNLVTDAGMIAILRNCKLRSLFIRNAPLLTDRMLEEIVECPTLCELYLEGTSITDNGVEPVGTLPDLWSLGIGRTAITDFGLARIASTRIGAISFDDCAVTGSGFSSWSVIGKMSLSACGSKLNDAGFGTVCAAFPFLWNAYVERTEVTNAGIRALKGQQLTALRIHGSKIDREGVIWIIQNLPPLQLLEVDPRQFSTDEALTHKRRHLRIAVYESQNRSFWAGDSV